MTSTPAGVPVRFSTSATVTGAATAMEPATIPPATARIAIRILIAHIRSVGDDTVPIIPPAAYRSQRHSRPDTSLKVPVARVRSLSMVEAHWLPAIRPRSIRLEHCDARMCDGHHTRSLFHHDAANRGRAWQTGDWLLAGREIRYGRGL